MKEEKKTIVHQMSIYQELSNIDVASDPTTSNTPITAIKQYISGIFIYLYVLSGYLMKFKIIRYFRLLLCWLLLAIRFYLSRIQGEVIETIRRSQKFHRSWLNSSIIIWHILDLL